MVAIWEKELEEVKGRLNKMDYLLLPQSLTPYMNMLQPISMEDENNVRVSLGVLGIRDCF